MQLPKTHLSRISAQQASISLATWMYATPTAFTTKRVSVPKRKHLGRSNDLRTTHGIRTPARTKGFSFLRAFGV